MPNPAQLFVGFSLAALLVFVVPRLMRGKWDLLAEHSRDLMRHLLAAVLMLGTMAGTVWTFSAGRLTLNGWLERLVSVGGIAGALEAGVIYCGWYLGQLDQRIAGARRDRLPDLLARRRSVNRWFYLTAGISAIANFIFRSQQLGNPFLAAFVSAAPLVLIILLLIKLRPLPTDYSEKARQATGRALYMMVTQAEKTVMHAIRKPNDFGPGSEQSLQLSLAILRSYASNAEAQALDYGFTAQSGADSTQVYVTSAQLMAAYGIPARTAQDWLSKCPGARPRRDGAQGKEAPLDVIQRAHGLPGLALPAPLSGRKRRNATQIDADVAQAGAYEAQNSGLSPQEGVSIA